MSEEANFWALDSTEAAPPAGETVERWLYRGLKGNMFSRQGALLRRATSPITPRDDGNRQETLQRIHRLVRTSGIAYRAKEVEHDDAVTLATTATARAAEENTTETAQQPLPTTSTDSASDVPPPAAVQPCAGMPSLPCPVGSGLARLIYEAKAGHAPRPQASSTALQQHETTVTSEFLTHKRGRVALSSLLHRSSSSSKSSSNDEEEEFGVVLPGVMAAETPGSARAAKDDAASAKHPSQMTREEFLRQFKRAPRRGEIGQSAEEIAQAEQLGYVMSGSRSKAAQLYVDRVQRQLHEREAAKLQRQFRKVEDERMDASLITHLAQIVNAHGKKRIGQ